MTDSTDEEEMSSCSCCCWHPRLLTVEPERGPLVSNGRRKSPKKPALRMSWGHTSPDTTDHTLLEAGTVLRFAGGRYSVCTEAGRGAHCVVWQCMRVSRHGEPMAFALKVHNEEAAALKREASALEALEATRAGPTLFPHLYGSVQLNKRTCLVLSLHGPDLYQLQKLRDRKPFPSAFVWAVAAQLLSALEALEAVKLVHVRCSS